MKNSVSEIIEGCNQLLMIAESKDYEERVTVVSICQELRMAMRELKRLYDTSDVLEENTLTDAKQKCNHLAITLERELDDEVYKKRARERKWVLKVVDIVRNRVKDKRLVNSGDRTVYRDLLTSAEVSPIAERATIVNFDLTDKEREKVRQVYYDN